MHGAAPLHDVKSISAVKKRPSGHARAKAKHRGGWNVIWKRIELAWEQDLKNWKKFGTNPSMVAPLSRWVIFTHISSRQARAGRGYAAIVRAFERYTLPSSARTPQSANWEPSPRGGDQEIERHINNGTLREYESDADGAKKAYRKSMKVLERYADPITGRNLAKDMLDTLCLQEQEIPDAYRKDIGIVLSALADAYFGKEER
jgi:hypothetical protein